MQAGPAGWARPVSFHQPPGRSCRTSAGSGKLPDVLLLDPFSLLLSLTSLNLGAYGRLARLDRPVGTLLLLWPTLAALFAAAGGWPGGRLLAVFSLGTILMRSAGCVINDILDRHHDGLVERTRNRPLPRGDLTVSEAVLWLALLLCGALLIALMLSPLTLAVSVGGLVIAGLYPLMKRWTYLPQVVLGAAFSWGLIMAYVEVTGSTTAPTWLLFTGSLLWIVAYDTWYAMVDRDDDLKAGIKSTAILFGAQDRSLIAVLQIAAWLILMLFGLQTKAGLLYYAGLGVMACTFWYQHRLGQDRSASGCFKAFANNVWSGFALFCGVVTDSWIWPLVMAHV